MGDRGAACPVDHGQLSLGGGREVRKFRRRRTADRGVVFCSKTPPKTKIAEPKLTERRIGTRLLAPQSTTERGSND